MSGVPGGPQEALSVHMLRIQGKEEFASGIMSVYVMGDLGPAAEYLLTVGIFSAHKWTNIRAIVVDDPSYTKVSAGCPTSIVRRGADQRVILVKSISIVKTGNAKLVVQSGRNPVLAVVGNVPLDRLNLVNHSSPTTSESAGAEFVSGGLQLDA